MDSVLTVIGAPGSSAIDNALVEAARDGLARLGAACGAPDWLCPGVACDIPFAGAAPETVEPALRARLAGAPADILAQPAEGRRKALLVADMESTMIGQEMLDELAEAADLGPGIAEITTRTMAGEIEFEEALKERVALLKDLPEEVLEQVSAQITLNPGARVLVQSMRAAGAYTALVSGGFTCFAEPARGACGFDEVRANRLVVAEGRLTGTVAEPILDRAAKRETLMELAASRGLKMAETCAVGDGANDLDMIEAAGLGAAYRAKAVLRKATRVHIDHGDLTALLYLQGYRREEFRD